MSTRRTNDTTRDERVTVGAGRRLQLGPGQVVREDWETDRAILVGVAHDAAELGAEEESLAELGALAETAGAEVVTQHLQLREAPSPATYVGSGKVDEIGRDAEAHDATLIVFDDELSPAQQRNLEKAFGGRRVLDRTQLILDIFAQHATTREGKVQVELAQLKYRLPRLRGRGEYLSRLGAGIGTRGPGETVLEVDRRRITERLSRLQRELRSLDTTRRTRRKGRRRSGLPAVSLVGYTNAGKSTLLNRICDADVIVENKLFSTLDTTVRRKELAGGRTLLLSDTVGFVRKLPHDLVQAFRSTLEETAEADLLVHVVDAAAVDPFGNIAVVRQVLREVGAEAVDEMIVWNKADLVLPGTMRRLIEAEPGSIAVSAATGAGIEELLDATMRRIDAHAGVLELLVPFGRGDVVSDLHRSAEILTERHDPDGTRLRVRVPPREAGRWNAWRESAPGSAGSSGEPPGEGAGDEHRGGGDVKAVG